MKITKTVAGAILALGLLYGCTRETPAEGRRKAVSAVLEAHLGHEAALLGILEQGAVDWAATKPRLDAYLRDHGGDMKRLCGERRLLEGDPDALAGAMQGLEPAMASVFDRRRRLLERYPDLMVREEVRVALGALDDL